MQVDVSLFDSHDHNGINTEFFTPNPEWTVLNPSAEVIGLKFPCCPHDVYQSLEITFRVARAHSQDSEEQESGSQEEGDSSSSEEDEGSVEPESIPQEPESARHRYGGVPQQHVSVPHRGRHRGVPNRPQRHGAIRHEIFDD